MKYKAGQRVRFKLHSGGDTVIITNLFSTSSGNLWYYGTSNDRRSFFSNNCFSNDIKAETIEILHNPRMPEPKLIGAAVTGYSGTASAKEIFSRTRSNCWYNHTSGHFMTWEEIREPEPWVVTWTDDRIKYDEGES